MKTKPQKFSLPFLRYEQVATNTYSFFFDRTGFDFDFIPGQYVHMTLPHKSPDERGTSRYFTIASSPREKAHLMVTTKMMQSTFKETLHGLQKGQAVHFFGPMGWFLQAEDEAFAHKVFIAGGIGITPFRSLLLTVGEQKLDEEMTLLALFSNKEDALFAKELKAIAKQNPKITVIYSFSKAQEDKDAEDETGRLSDKLLKKYIKDIHQPKYYVVGSIGMVAHTKAVLESLQIPEEKIFTEDFTGY